MRRPTLSRDTWIGIAVGIVGVAATIGMFVAHVEQTKQHQPASPTAGPGRQPGRSFPDPGWRDPGIIWRPSPEASQHSGNR